MSLELDISCCSPVISPRKKLFNIECSPIKRLGELNKQHRGVAYMQYEFDKYYYKIKSTMHFIINHLKHNNQLTKKQVKYYINRYLCCSTLHFNHSIKEKIFNDIDNLDIDNLDIDNLDIDNLDCND